MLSLHPVHHSTRYTGLSKAAAIASTVRACLPAFGLTPLTPNPIAVRIEPMRVGRTNLEPPVRDIAAVEIGRRWRDADGRIGRVAVRLRRRARCGRGRRWR